MSFSCRNRNLCCLLICCWDSHQHRVFQKPSVDKSWKATKRKHQYNDEFLCVSWKREIRGTRIAVFARGGNAVVMDAKGTRARCVCFSPSLLASMRFLRTMRRVAEGNEGLVFGVAAAGTNRSIVKSWKPPFRNRVHANTDYTVCFRCYSPEKRYTETKRSEGDRIDDSGLRDPVWCRCRCRWSC